MITIKHIVVEARRLPCFFIGKRRERMGKDNYEKIEEYSGMGFDHWQMHEIRLGLERKIDVSVYADPKFENGQMMEIRLGLA
jgi:hypothetical protein